MLEVKTSAVFSLQLVLHSGFGVQTLVAQLAPRIAAPVHACFCGMGSKMLAKMYQHLSMLSYSKTSASRCGTAAPTAAAFFALVVLGIYWVRADGKERCAPASSSTSNARS